MVKVFLFFLKKRLNLKLTLFSFIFISLGIWWLFGQDYNFGDATTTMVVGI
jgi:hypothetical protein